MTENEAKCNEATTSGETPTVSERLGTFHKNLLSQGVPEYIADGMVARLFEAEVNGFLLNSGRDLADYR